MVAISKEIVSLPSPPLEPEDSTAPNDPPSLMSRRVFVGKSFITLTGAIGLKGLTNQTEHQLQNEHTESQLSPSVEDSYLRNKEEENKSIHKQSRFADALVIGTGIIFFKSLNDLRETKSKLEKKINPTQVRAFETSPSEPPEPGQKS